MNDYETLLIGDSVIRYMEVPLEGRRRSAKDAKHQECLRVVFPDEINVLLPNCEPPKSIHF